MHPGTCTTCDFQRDKALCRQHCDVAGGTRLGFGNCRPLECGNALTTDNLSALRAALDHNLLSTRSMSTPLLLTLDRPDWTAITSISSAWITFGRSQNSTRRAPRNAVGTWFRWCAVPDSGPARVVHGPVWCIGPVRVVLARVDVACFGSWSNVVCCRGGRP
jgi:hypothetical protein